MLPGRLGPRFALEAIFIVLLAVGAGLADLRPAFIVLVMAAAWLLVALVELAAERIARSPVSYLLPAEAADEADEEEPEHVFEPPVEERTVVAPPQALEDTQEPVARAEPAAEPMPGPEPEPQEVRPEAEVEAAAVADPEAESLELPPRRRLGLLLRRSRAEPESEPEPQETSPPQQEPEPAAPPRRRSLLRRREPEPEPLPEPPPRHVKLLPRRPAAEPGPIAHDVAELFEPSGEGEADREETAG